MKNLLAIFLLALYLSNCTDTDDVPREDILSGTWNLQNISGGFAGINDDYDPGTIVWVFAAANSTLQVDNSNTSNTIYDGLPSGEYTYRIVTIQNEMFLEIDGQEFSGFSISNGQLILDQNKTSSGSGADGFVILFNP